VTAAVAALGASVTAYDPAAAVRAARVLPGIRYAGSVTDAAADAHVLLVLTDWPEFAELDPAELGRVVARRAVADGRHALDGSRWRAAGWSYGILGGYLEQASGEHRDRRMKLRAAEPARRGATGGLPAAG